MNENHIKDVAKWISLAALVVFLFSFDITKSIAVIGFMCMVSYSIGRVGSALTNASIGVSFTKFMIMLVMFWFGIKVAVVAGIFMYLVEFFGQNYWKAPVIATLIIVAFMPLYGFWLVNVDIVWGLALLAVSNVLEGFASMLLGTSPSSALMYYGTNIVFNIPIFLTLGPVLVQ